MGVNLGWIALEGRSKASLLEQLGFEVVGDASDPLQAAFALGESPSRWNLFVARDRDFEFEPALAAVSSEGFVLGCEMYETVMFSRTRGFHGGREVWSVTRDPDKHPAGVEVAGAPPPQLGEIQRRLEAQQADDQDGAVDDLFDVPIELAVSICGYRPDETSPVDWSVLRPKAAGRTGDERPAQFLSPLIRAELVPLLQSLGCAFAKDQPDQARNTNLYDVYRRQGGLSQRMWFDYGAGGGAPYFATGFAVWDPDAPEDRKTVLVGRMEKPQVRLPLRKRLAGLFAKPPPPSAEPLGEVIAEARQHIIAADIFLKGGERHPDVRVERGLAKDSWPALPARPSEAPGP